jgi:multiple sugar transport system substrate-binding protein
VTVPLQLPVVITIAGRLEEAELALLDEQIAAFEAENPDVRVEVVSERRDDSRRRQDLAGHLAEGDKSRDILLVHPTWLAEFAAEGWLRRLDAYLRAQGVVLDAFFPAAIQAATIAGETVALPWVVDGGLLYYRRDLLAEAGYEPPTTWDDVKRIALAARAAEGSPHAFVWQGAAYETLTCATLEFVWAAGGAVLDPEGIPVFDSAATRTGLQQMADLVTLGVSPAAVTTYQETATFNAFSEGDALFMRNWAYAWDRLRNADMLAAGRVGLAPLPASCLGGEVLALSAHSLHPEQAVRFMAFLVDYDQQLQLAQRGVQPPALEAVYADAGLLVESPIFEALHAGLSATRPRPQSTAYLALSEAVYTEVHRMLLGEQDAETTSAAVQRRLEHLLQ